MADWINWLIAAGVLIVLELFTGTFYLLMIAVGLVFGAIAAWLGVSVAAQLIAAAVIGVAATILLHRSRFGRPARSNATRDPNVNMDIGQSVTVDSWQDGRARVMYRGALWDVELAPGAIAEAGRFRIVEIRGSELIVGNF